MTVLAAHNWSNNAALIAVQILGALICFACASLWPYASLGRAVGGILGSFWLVLLAVEIAVTV